MSKQDPQPNDPVEAQWMEDLQQGAVCSAPELKQRFSKGLLVDPAL